ncbi:hypothetical protein LCGC14_2339900 [marine sediment metagenome]|uniref:Uncharacterized protein n=1 Tax=marine sediment metagenome TaxID=412755 RepID=A0A0F9CZW5_9ZZZZ
MRHKHEYCPCLLCNTMEQIEAGIIMCIIDDCFARKPIKEITIRKEEVDKMIDQLPLVDMNTTVGKQQICPCDPSCNPADYEGKLMVGTKEGWHNWYFNNPQRNRPS